MTSFLFCQSASLSFFKYAILEPLTYSKFGYEKIPDQTEALFCFPLKSLISSVGLGIDATQQAMVNNSNSVGLHRFESNPGVGNLKKSLSMPLRAISSEHPL